MDSREKDVWITVAICIPSFSAFVTCLVLLLRQFWIQRARERERALQRQSGSRTAQVSPTPSPSLPDDVDRSTTPPVIARSIVMSLVRGAQQTPAGSQRDPVSRLAAEETSTRPSDGCVNRGTRSLGDCTVCQCEIRDELVTLPCGHLFHAECIVAWTVPSWRDTCPNCRACVRTGTVVTALPV
jgi:hypothetical protein